MTWHRFYESSDDDSECRNHECGVIVSDDALRLYNEPCPAPPCTDASNTGPCVMVPGHGGPVCAYCERCGYKSDGDDPDDLDDEDSDDEA